MNPVLARIRASLATRAHKAAYPDWDADIVVCSRRLELASLTQCFEANFNAVNGMTMRGVAEVADYLRQGAHLHGYCAPELVATGRQLSESGVGITFSADYDATRYDDYQFGITRATAAIAESGSIILRDSETSDRLGALTPWVHIAVLESNTILRTIGNAVAAFGDDPNIIWVTGPSKTADVEGILIEGVHGPGVQIALIV